MKGLSKKVLREINDNRALRLKICEAMEISENGVLKAVLVNSKSLLNYFSVKVIKDFMKLKEEEIFIEIKK